MWKPVTLFLRSFGRILKNLNFLPGKTLYLGSSYLGKTTFRAGVKGGQAVSMHTVLGAEAYRKSQ
jgi:hypothetical protein